MNIIAVVMASFALLGAADRILGNRFGLGKEFEKGFLLMGNLALSIIGMIVIAPLIADLLEPLFFLVSEGLHLDPSIIPASLFANDMGGAPLAAETALSEKMGKFNGLIVASMMGCTISFTIPAALEVTEQQIHKEVLLGFLCGIVTIPVGCLVAGLLIRMPLRQLLGNLLPLILFAVVIAVGLLLFPVLCVKVFSVFGIFIKILIIFGLGLGIWIFLTGMELLPGLGTLEEGAMICVNACVVMSGAFPLIFLVSKVFARPLAALGKGLRITPVSAMGFLSTLATSLPTFEAMHQMDKKGIVLNAAFSISAAFLLADHLAFTMAYDAEYLFPMMAGKIISGIAAVFLALIIYKRSYPEKGETSV